MTSAAEQRLADLKIDLPPPRAPIADYVACKEAGGTLYISGQVAFDSQGKVIKGRLGSQSSVEEGSEAARLCAISILSQARAELGSLDRITGVSKLNVFVTSDAEFSEHSLVANGASRLMISVLGDLGRHARTAIGVAALPLEAIVEVDAVLTYR